MSRSSASQKKNDSIQHQIILDQMLQDESNKKCADCWARNPRWASWNLGVFICIRCAGIHRNLGVHISRVKSVGLDSWTEEQINSMQKMGNALAAAIYEANLPDNFKYSRPENDHTLERLIRDKYERKLYYDKNGTLSTVTRRQHIEEEPKKATSTSPIPSHERHFSNGSQSSNNHASDFFAAPKKIVEQDYSHPDGKPLIEF